MMHFPVLFLKISISSQSTAKGAWQRCWRLYRTVFTPKYLSSVPYPSPAVQFRCLLMPLVCLLLLELVEQNSSQHFLFFTQCYSKSFIFYHVWICTRNDCFIWHNIYNFYYKPLRWMCQSVVGLFSLRVLKEESPLCACKFGMCFPCVEKKKGVGSWHLSGAKPKNSVNLVLNCWNMSTFQLCCFSLCCDFPRVSHKEGRRSCLRSLSKAFAWVWEGQRVPDWFGWEGT